MMSAPLALELEPSSTLVDPEDYAPSSLEAQLHDAIANGQQRVRDLFASWDVDGSGTLDLEDVRKSLYFFA